ncbi:hypothetical protein AALD22_09705 [Lachnospiraceae bacterium 56-18]
MSRSYGFIRRRNGIKKGDGDMADKEMLQKNVEEFSRLQRYMLLSDKNSEAYRVMKDRYIELKIILTASGINLTELDKIKE